MAAIDGGFTDRRSAETAFAALTDVDVDTGQTLAIDGGHFSNLQGSNL